MLFSFVFGYLNFNRSTSKVDIFLLRITKKPDNAAINNKKGVER